MSRKMKALLGFSLLAFIVIATVTVLVLSIIITDTIFTTEIPQIETRVLYAKADLNQNETSMSYGPDHVNTYSLQNGDFIHRGHYSHDRLFEMILLSLRTGVNIKIGPVVIDPYDQSSQSAIDLFGQEFVSLYIENDQGKTTKYLRLLNQ